MSEKDKDLVVASGAVSLFGGNFLPPTTFKDKSQPAGEISKYEAFPPVVFEGVEHVFCWPEASKAFSERTRTDAQNVYLDKLKSNPRISSILHESLESMPGYLLEKVFGTVNKMSEDSRERTEYLLEFIFQYMGRVGAHGNRRFLLGQKTRRYLNKALKELYNDSANSFSYLDENTKIGRVPAEMLLVDTIVFAETFGNKTLANWFRENAIYIPYAEVLNEGVERKEFNLRFAEEVVVVMASLEIEAYTHIQHARLVENDELFEILSRLNRYLASSNRQARDNGYRFAPINYLDGQDSVSWARKKAKELEENYKKKGIFTPKQKSYVLSIIGQIQDKLKHFEDPSLMALIKTKVGVLEIRQDEAGKINATILTLAQLDSKLMLTNLSSVETELEIDSALVWNLDWLSAIHIGRDDLLQKSRDKHFKMCFASEIIKQILLFFSKINMQIDALGLNTQVAQESCQAAREIMDNQLIQVDFQVERNSLEILMGIYEYLDLYKEIFQNAKNQQKFQVFHEEIFGGMFEVFTFLKKISGGK